MRYLSTKQFECYVRNWITFGFFVYLGCFFVLSSSKILSFFLVFVVLPVLFLCLVSKFRCMQDKRAIFICAAFLGYLSLSSLWGEGGFFKAIRYSVCILCLMISVEVVSQKYSANFIIKSIIFAGFIAALSFIVVILGPGHDLITFVMERVSLYEISRWGNKNPIDSAVIIGIPVIAAWYFFPGRKIHVQLLLIVTIILCSLFMLATQSRGPVLAVAITLLCIVLYRREKGDFFLLVLFAVLICIAFTLFNTFSDTFVDRFKQENYRLLVWHEALKLFMDHWAFGQGYGTSAKILIIPPSGSVTHAHNTAIEILRIGGIIGGVLFVYMFVSMVRFSYIRYRNKFFLFWLLFGLLCLSTNGRLPLVYPGDVEFFAFWLPFLLFYFQKNPPDSPVTGIAVAHDRVQPFSNALRPVHKYLWCFRISS